MSKAAPKPKATMAAALVGIFLFGCTPAPEPFHLGEDVGAYCRMTIDDARYATQIVMQTGKVYKFDSIECAASFVDEVIKDDNQVYGIWVSDAANPGVLVAADAAVFVRHPSIHSPMGGGWAAYTSEAGAREALRVLPAADSGQILITDFAGVRTKTHEM